MLNEETSRRLIETIHRAALDPLRWQDVANEIDRATDAGGVAIHLIDEAARMSMPIAATAFDPGYLESYIAHYGSVSPWPEIFPSLPRGKARQSFSDIPEEEYVRTEFYQDWMRPQEDRVSSVGVRTIGTGPRSLFATINMRRRDRDRLEIPALQMFDWMHVHLSHALAVNEAIAELSTRRLLAQPDQFPGGPLESGIVIVTAERLLCWANAGAVALFDKVLRLSPIGRLNFFDATAQHWLEGVVAALARRDPSSRLPPLQLALRAHERRLTIRALSVDGVTPSIAHHYVPDADRTHAIALIIEDANKERSPAERLRDRFGLSATEAEIALWLAEGLDTHEIAELRQVSRNTVRNQIQSVLTKLGARHRGELIRLISIATTER